MSRKTKTDRLTYAELYRLAAKCLTLDDYPEKRDEIHALFAEQRVSPEKFILFCDNHLVLTTIVNKLARHGIINCFPDELKEHLLNIFQLNRQRNAGILEQVSEICEALKNENIEPVFMKGAAHLLAGLYNDPGERLMGDIDFLVSPEDYMKTVEILLSMNYNPQSIWGDITKSKHYPRLLHPDKPADIEVHRSPVNWEYTRMFNAATVSLQKEAVADRVNCYIPSARHMLIQNFIHSQLSNNCYKHKNTPLRDVYDFYLLSKKTDIAPVLPQIEEKQKAIGYFGFSAHLLGMTNTDIPVNIRSRCHIALSNFFIAWPSIARNYNWIQKFTEMFIIRYPKTFVHLLFRNELRTYISLRINDPEWRKRYSSSLKKHFG